MFEKSLALSENALAQGVFPCAAAVIGCGDRVLRTFCLGTVSREAGAAECTPDTLFDMASLTKIIVTTAITLKLMERGLLSLDDLLSEFYDVPPAYQNVTLRHLLTHTSGIAGHFLLETLTTDTDVTNQILSCPPSYPTGSRTEYSCMGFIVLGRLLEKITGTSLSNLAEREVFKPLSMTKTCYLPDRPCAPTERTADGSHFLNGLVHDENARFLGGVSGNAGVFSSLSDMTRFARMLACRGVLDGNRFLQERTLDIAAKNYTPGFAENRGLGFKLSGGASNFFGDLLHAHSFGHTGFTGTSLAIEPDTGLFVVLLTNRVHPTRENQSILRFRRLFHNSIAAEFAAGCSAVLPYKTNHEDENYDKHRN